MSSSRGMDSKEVVHVYNGILLSHGKEWNNAICNSMDGPRACHTEWSKSKKNTWYCLYEKSNKSAEMNLSTKQSYRCKNKNKKPYGYLGTRKGVTVAHQAPPSMEFSRQEY